MTFVCQADNHNVDDVVANERKMSSTDLSKPNTLRKLPAIQVTSGIGVLLESIGSCRDAKISNCALRRHQMIRMTPFAFQASVVTTNVDWKMWYQRLHHRLDAYWLEFHQFPKVCQKWNLLTYLYNHKWDNYRVNSCCDGPPMILQKWKCVMWY